VTSVHSSSAEPFVNFAKLATRGPRSTRGLRSTKAGAETLVLDDGLAPVPGLPGLHAIRARPKTPTPDLRAIPVFSLVSVHPTHGPPQTLALSTSLPSWATVPETPVEATGARSRRRKAPCLARERGASNLHRPREACAAAFLALAPCLHYAHRRRIVNAARDLDAAVHAACTPLAESPRSRESLLHMDARIRDDHRARSHAYPRV
jgi:hypothetical protein